MISDTPKGILQDKLSLNSMKWIAIVVLTVTVLAIDVLAMTSREKGESFITIQVKIEAKATGKDPCDILTEWLSEAKRDGDKQLVLKIEAAEKFMGCRNQQKRGKSKAQ